MSSRDFRWLALANMSVWSVLLNKPRMSWSLICCSWMSCWQFEQVNLQSGTIDFQPTTNSWIGSVSDWWSELKCNWCTVGLDFLVTICSNVCKSWVAFKSKKIVTVFTRLVGTVSVQLPYNWAWIWLGGMLVICLKIFQSILNLRNCGWEISVWICGGLAAGAFIKMVLGICSDGWVVEVVVLVAVGQGWAKPNIILMSPSMVIPKSIKSLCQIY